MFGFSSKTKLFFVWLTRFFLSSRFWILRFDLKFSVLFSSRSLYPGFYNLDLTVSETALSVNQNGCPSTKQNQLDNWRTLIWLFYRYGCIRTPMVHVVRFSLRTKSIFFSVFHLLYKHRFWFDLEIRSLKQSSKKRQSHNSR